MMSRVRATIGVFGAAARNCPLLAVVVSFAAFNMVEWGVWVTLRVRLRGRRRRRPTG